MSLNFNVRQILFLGAIAALSMVFPAIAQLPMTSPQVSADYYERGLSRYAQGDWEGAIADLSQLIRLNPNNSNAYYQRGIALHNLASIEYGLDNSEKGQNLNQQAITDFSQAIQLDPNFAEAYYWRGRTRRRSWKDNDSYLSFEKYEARVKEELEDFSEAIRIKPDFVQAYYSRGLVLMQLAGDGVLAKSLPHDAIKQYQLGAIADLTKAIQLRPTFAAAYYLRAKVQDNLQLEQSAKKDFLQVIQLDPNLFDTYPRREYLAELELRDNQADLRTLAQMLQKNSKNFDVLYQRGFVRLDLGDPQGSIEDFRQIIQQKSNDLDAYFGRGFYLLQTKKSIGLP